MLGYRRNGMGLHGKAFDQVANLVKNYMLPVPLQ